MIFSRGLHAIDSHTAGEPTRILIGGLPTIKGATMPEKKAYLEKNLDHIRTAVMLEPRGHNDMFGSILTTPTVDEADFGIIFMDGGGYLNMCGHGTIGAVTAAIETGMVEMVEPVTKVVLEAPAGIVHASSPSISQTLAPAWYALPKTRRRTAPSSICAAHVPIAWPTISAFCTATCTAKRRHPSCRYH